MGGPVPVGGADRQAAGAACGERWLGGWLGGGGDSNAFMAPPSSFHSFILSFRYGYLDVADHGPDFVDLLMQVGLGSRVWGA